MARLTRDAIGDLAEVLDAFKGISSDFAVTIETASIQLNTGQSFDIAYNPKTCEYEMEF